MEGALHRLQEGSLTRITRLASIMKHINFSPFASAPPLLSSSAARPLYHRHDLLRRHCARSPPPPRELLCLSPAAELTSPAPLALSSCGPLTLWAGRPLRHWRPGLGGRRWIWRRRRIGGWQCRLIAFATVPRQASPGRRCTFVSSLVKGRRGCLVGSARQ